MSILHKTIRAPALGIFVIAFVAAVVIGYRVPPTWAVQEIALEISTNEAGEQVVDYQGNELALAQAISTSDSPLTIENLKRLSAENESDIPTEQFVYRETAGDVANSRKYFQQIANRHWKYWSFLPSVTAIALCWITKEPITALLAGIGVGAALIGEFDVLGGILIPSIGTTAAATILILYLWLLGGLMGIWAKTGASEAFADYMSTHFVRGPRSAKFVAWLLGVVFFQGGTISAVLVGTTVRPLADEQRVSHEELSLIVDSTSSPIAILMAFNAWPLYVQAFLGVVGVSYLATQADRIAFFFAAIPLNFYAILAVLSTLLIALDKHPFLPKKLKAARQRALDTGQLNAPGAEPLANDDPEYNFVPKGYSPHVLEFILPLAALLGTAIGTYILYGSPEVLWAFGSAVVLAAAMAWLRGMKSRDIILGILDGQKGLILGSVILLLAITIGKLSQDVGGGHYLGSLIGNLEWHWLLPAIVFLIAVVIAFSTGTSWATFAVTLPLVMPLAHVVGVNQGLAHPKMFMSICFSACLNGGVFGDQCSPISDTTILSSMCTGADLMDHVITQIAIAAQAALIAVAGWTVIAFLCA